MKRRFRLTSPTEFKRVRRDGKSFAHPLIVLIVMPNMDQSLHIGVAAGRTLGGAVQRNRAKRILRAALQPLLPELTPGWDLILIARRPLLDVAWVDVQEAVRTTLRRARLVKDII
jgi:ribonuclease P protein component